MPETEHDLASDPEGNPAVVVLSDGARLILADGTVVRVDLVDESTDTHLPCVAPGQGLHRAPEDGQTVRVVLPTDEEAAQHPRVADARDKLIEG